MHQCTFREKNLPCLFWQWKLNSFRFELQNGKFSSNICTFNLGANVARHFCLNLRFGTIDKVLTFLLQTIYKYSLTYTFYNIDLWNWWFWRKRGTLYGIPAEIILATQCVIRVGNDGAGDPCNANTANNLIGTSHQTFPPS